MGKQTGLRFTRFLFNGASHLKVFEEKYRAMVLILILVFVVVSWCKKTCFNQIWGY